MFRFTLFLIGEHKNNNLNKILLTFKSIRYSEKGFKYSLLKNRLEEHSIQI